MVQREIMWLQLLNLLGFTQSKGFRMRWKIATHCSTNWSWVEQCVAIFHRMQNLCHCTALSDTFLYTSNVYEPDCKVTNSNEVEQRKAKTVQLPFTFAVWSKTPINSALEFRNRTLVCLRPLVCAQCAKYALHCVQHAKCLDWTASEKVTVVNMCAINAQNASLLWWRH